MSPPIKASSVSSSLSTFSTTSIVDPMTNYLHSLMKQRIAVICSSLGWQSMHGSCLQILVDLLARHIKNLGIEMQRRAECCNRTEANLVDVQRVFAEVGITMKELEDYVENFDTKESVNKSPVVQFPAPADNNLNFLKPGSREVLHRKVHINEYFPPMYPELEEEPESTVATGIVRVSAAVVSPGSGVDERSLSTAETSDAGVKRESRCGSSAEGGGFLEPMPPAQLDPQDPKKELSMTTSDGSGTSSEIMSHLRDIPSVMMTSAGFISPAREGKLPESRTPQGGAAAAAAAALREEREEEMRSLQRLQKKAMIAEEELRRQVASGAGQKQGDALTQAAQAAAVLPGPGSGSSPENRKKLAIFQKKSSGTASKAMKKHTLSTKVATEGAKFTSSPTTTKKSPKAVTSKKASSVGTSGTKLASTKKTTTTPPATQGQQAQRKKRGKVPVPISAEIVPDSPPSSPSPPPSHPPPPPPLESEENPSLTLPPPPPAQPPPATAAAASAPESSSGAVDNPLIPRGSNFYGFDIGSGGGISGSVDKQQRNEKVRTKEKKKKNKKDKLRDKKRKKEKIERWPSPTVAAAPAPASSADIPSTTSKSSSTPGVPKITFKGIGNETKKPETEKKVVIKPVVPPSLSKGDKKRRQMGATEDGDAYQMMFKEPLKIDRPTARSGEQQKGRKRQISGGKNVSTLAPQSQTAKRRKTVEPEPSSAAASKGATAVTVAPSNRRQRTSSSAEATDDSCSGKDGGGGGITVTQPVGHYVDEDGKEIWICPACGEQYNHLPMICCDRCDEWYHWMCVGISREPDESQDWYCMRCVSEIKETSGGKKSAKEKKKR